MDRIAELEAQLSEKPTLIAELDISKFQEQIDEVTKEHILKLGTQLEDCKIQFEAIVNTTGTKDAIKQIATDALKMWETDEQGTDENTSTDEQGTDETPEIGQVEKPTEESNLPA